MRVADCRASLAMTKVLSIAAKVGGIAIPSILVIARRTAPWQSSTSHSTRGTASLNRRMDCRGPSALAMTGREIRHCEARSAVAIHVPAIPATPPVSTDSRRRVDCRGPSALAMTGREIRHCEARSAVAIHTPYGIARLVHYDDRLDRRFPGCFGPGGIGADAPWSLTKQAVRQIAVSGETGFPHTTNT
jgi:hypothetical protein